MAFLSSNNIIITNRGDSFKFPVTIYSKDENNVSNLYAMQEGDFLYVAVLEPNQKWENALIKKTYDYTKYEADGGYVMVRFTSEDTQYVLAGNYYYEIRLYRAPQNVKDGYEAVDTILPRTKFTILD